LQSRHRCDTPRSSRSAIDRRIPTGFKPVARWNAAHRSTKLGAIAIALASFSIDEADEAK
jgi:hypothetical protein